MKRPEFLQVGQLVMTDGWPGEIADVAESDTGTIMVCINSPKAIWRNHRPEWLPYIEGRITPVSFERTVAIFDTYIERVEIMLENLKKMRTKWESNGETKQ